MTHTEKPKSERSRILIVINRKAGKGGDDNLEDLISAQAKSDGFDFQVHTMSGKNEEELIRAAIKKYKPSVVAAAGGDGTVNLLAGILANTKIKLSIIPYGSANGMAKELNIGNRIDNALELLANGIPKTIDLIRINGKICIHLADVGLNARVVKRFEGDTRRGILTYAKHLFGEMFLLKKYHFHIFYEGNTIRRKAVSMTFANASKYGTGAVINPEGILDDGRFELVIVKPFPRIKLLSIAWKMFLHTLHTSDYVEIIRCKKAMVISNKRTTLQIDGEIIGKVKEINLEILPKAITVLTPG